MLFFYFFPRAIRCDGGGVDGKGGATLLNFDVVFSLLGFQKTFFGQPKTRSIVSHAYIIRLYVYININLIQEPRGARGYVVKSVTRSGKPFITNCSQTSTRSNDSVAASVFSPTPSRGFVFHFTRFNPRTGFIPTSKYIISPYDFPRIVCTTLMHHYNRIFLDGR